MIGKEDVALFVSCLPKKKRILLEEIWETVKRAFPGQGTSIDWPGRIAELLEALAREGAISLPKSKKLYVGTPPLPAWIARHDVEQRLVERIKGYIWSPELAFMGGQAPELDSAWLQIDAWLKAGGRFAEPIPSRERSLEIFNNEKRLDDLLKSRPFKTGLITLEALRCYYVAAPIAWRPGPEAARHLPGIVVENANTWRSLCDYNEVAARYAYVAFGCGKGFTTTQEGAAEVAAEFGHDTILYFGDVDWDGFEIPLIAAQRLKGGGIKLKLEEWLYALLLEESRVFTAITAARTRKMSREMEALVPPGLLPKIKEILAAKHRLPQEMVSRRILMRHSGA